MLQTAVIVAIIVYKLNVLSGGTDVMLQIEPVDPRDLLRGDYVTFRYHISRLDPDLFDGAAVRNGDTVYVTLRKVGDRWEEDGAGTQMPENSSGPFIKGKAASGGTGREYNSGHIRSSRDPRILVIYGIEEYFIPEGTGAGLSLTQGTKALARITLDAHGNAVLRRIYIDGTPWP